MSRATMGLAALLGLLASPGGAPIAQVRMTPEEARVSSFDGGSAGSSGLTGIRTKVLVGDPTAPTLYSILLSVPANTTIPAHTHRDARIASVVAGEWHIGYGGTFDEAALKRLPPGSVYSEPAGIAHFARTGSEPVIVQITGVGPTDTRFVEPAKEPAKR
jgi:quercetin dioxygenase-like cupin family protein